MAVYGLEIIDTFRGDIDLDGYMDTVRAWASMATEIAVDPDRGSWQSDLAVGEGRLVLTIDTVTRDALEDTAWPR